MKYLLSNVFFKHFCFVKDNNKSHNGKALRFFKLINRVTSQTDYFVYLFWNIRKFLNFLKKKNCKVGLIILATLTCKRFRTIFNCHSLKVRKICNSLNRNSTQFIFSGFFSGVIFFAVLLLLNIFLCVTHYGDSLTIRACITFLFFIIHEIVLPIQYHFKARLSIILKYKQKPSICI